MRLPSRLLRRKAGAHKGDFGQIFILAGSGRFSGAAVLCAEAAMRAGAGLVTVGIPRGINNALIKIKPKEVMTLPLPQTREGSLSMTGLKEVQNFVKRADVLVFGPGLSQNKSTQELVRSALIKSDKPTVVDADGLDAAYNSLRHCERARCTILAGERSNLILTPHPGEMSRLTGEGVKKIQQNREEVARKFAKRYKVTLVLKGHKSVVADYQGRLYTNKTGNPGMATAGSGDVLSGIIGAFLAQGLDAFSAAKYAVYLHGLAGDLAAKEKTQLGMIASDIIAKIPEAIKRCS